MNTSPAFVKSNFLNHFDYFNFKKESINEINIQMRVGLNMRKFIHF